MADAQLEEMLADAVQQPPKITLRGLCTKMGDAAKNHAGRFPAYILAAPSQVAIWCSEMHDTRHPTHVVQIMGTRVIPCAGPIRLIWSEELKL